MRKFAANMKGLAEFSWFADFKALYCLRESAAGGNRDKGSGRGYVPKSHSNLFETEHSA